LHKYDVTPIKVVSSITNNLSLPMNAAFIYSSLSVTTAEFFPLDLARKEGPCDPYDHTVEF